jgi:cytochrome c-type biogenesis protein CcmH
MIHYRMARLSATLVLVLAFAGAAAVAASARPTIQEVGEGLTCQCGCGLTVANCNHPTCGFAIPTRGEIAGMIGSGFTRLQILQSFRAKYGEKVLSAPTTQGFNLLAWVMPYVMVGAGVLLIVVAVTRWRRPPESLAAPSDRPAIAAGGAELQADLRQRLERDLRRQL